SERVRRSCANGGPAGPGGGAARRRDSPSAGPLRGCSIPALPGPVEEATVMRFRFGAPLAAAALALLGAPAARAGHCGAANYDSCSQPCCDAQTSFASCNNQSKASYKVVYDTVMEKRFHVCHQTVTETVMKPVCKTCYREEQKTCYKTVKETVNQQVCETVCKPVHETCYKECHYTTYKQVQETCYKECHQTVCKPVYECCTEKHCHQVCKKVCEQQCH